MDIFREKARKFIESSFMEWFMLSLAGIAVGMHLIYLLAIFEGPQAQAFFILSLAVDLIFVVDFMLKLFVLRMDYLKSPWIIVDFLAAIPVISTFAEGVELFYSLRTMRWLRAFRFFRTLRAMKALRSMKFLVKMPESINNQLQFDKVIKYGVIIFAVLFIVLLTSIQAAKVNNFKAELELYVSGTSGTDKIGQHQFYLQEDMVGETVDYVTVAVNIDGLQQAIYFSSNHITQEMKVIEFYLLLGTIMGVSFAMLLSYVQQKDSNVQLVFQLLNVFLPEKVIKSFMDDEDAFYKQVHDKATIVFIDIAGFTKSVEKYKNEPDYLNDNLKAVLDVIVGAMVKHDVIVDKIIGDAALSFRGGPLVEEDDQENAVRVALASMEAIEGVKQLDNPVYKKIKVGITTGYCLIGAGGSSHRLSYTVLGDIVNLAARLEPASGKIGATNLIDEETYMLIKERLKAAYSFRRVGVISVTGKTETASVYEILPFQKNTEWLQDYARGVQHRSGKNWGMAVSSFEAADSARPGGDPVSRLFIANCKMLSTMQLPEDWDGSLEYVKSS